MTRRNRWTYAVQAITAAAWLLALVGPGPVGAGQEEQFTPEFRAPRSPTIRSTPRASRRRTR